MNLGLVGRVALVTGSSRGIGRAVSVHLAREGARVAITYRHDRDKAEDVAATIRGLGEEVASTIVFLASAANTTVNGEIILSSGGHA